MSQAIKLYDHQIKPIDFLRENRGLIIYHSTGSGKTLTAIFAAYQFPLPIIIIGTKSARKTFTDNIVKSNLNPNRFSFYTFSKIKKILESKITFFQKSVVIIDEAHNIRTENMYNLYITSALMVAEKVILLTATPVINYLNDLSVLVNIVSGSDVLPTDKNLFEQMFYDSEKFILVNKSILFDKIVNTISYYRASNDENYPTSKINYIEVTMNHAQMDEYTYYLRKVIYAGQTRVSTTEMLNINYNLLPGKKLNTFLNVTRQLSNTVNHSTDSPKIKEIFEYIQKGPYPIVIYSNFLKNGIYTLAILLEIDKIPYKTITGFTTDDKLNLIVNNYNNGLYKVLLISSAGSESLDLKNTRQIHIMEPHWNESRIDQVIGRTIRYQSHQALPLSKRHVDIYRWISIFPPHICNLSADQYLRNLSEKKRSLWEQFQDLVISASIENNYYDHSTKSIQSSEERNKMEKQNGDEI